MAYELVYTSIPHGIKQGTSGFCTAAYTNGLGPNIIMQLEGLSGYKPFFPHYDANAERNPIAFSHYICSVAGKRIHVVSRTSFCGLDYTGRSNKISHHIVPDLDEMDNVKSGPSSLFHSAGLFLDAWTGDPRLYNSPKRLPLLRRQFSAASTWAAYTGDAGWAGTLANHFLTAAGKPAFVVFDPLTHVDTLALVDEAIQLIPENKRWNVTFNTYLSMLPAGVQCAWRFCVPGSDIYNAAKRTPGVLIIDLTKPMASAEDGELQNAARSGQPPASQRNRVTAPAAPAAAVSASSNIPGSQTDDRILPAAEQKKNRMFTSNALRPKVQAQPQMQPQMQVYSMPLSSARKQQMSGNTKLILAFSAAVILILTGCCGFLLYSMMQMKKDEALSRSVHLEKDRKPEETKKKAPEETKKTKPEETKKTKPEEAKKTKPEEAKKTAPEEAKKKEPEKAAEQKTPEEATKKEQGSEAKKPDANTIKAARLALTDALPYTGYILEPEDEVTEVWVRQQSTDYIGSLTDGIYTKKLNSVAEGKPPKLFEIAIKKNEKGETVIEDLMKSSKAKLIAIKTKNNHVIFFHEIDFAFKKETMSVKPVFDKENMWTIQLPKFPGTDEVKKFIGDENEYDWYLHDKPVTEASFTLSDKDEWCKKAVDKWNEYNKKRSDYKAAEAAKAEAEKCKHREFKEIEEGIRKKLVDFEKELSGLEKTDGKKYKQGNWPCLKKLKQEDMNNLYKMFVSKDSVDTFKKKKELDQWKELLDKIKEKSREAYKKEHNKKLPTDKDGKETTTPCENECNALYKLIEEKVQAEKLFEQKMKNLEKDLSDKKNAYDNFLEKEISDGTDDALQLRSKDGRRLAKWKVKSILFEEKSKGKGDKKHDK